MSVDGTRRAGTMFLIDTHFTPSAPEAFADFSAPRIIRGLKAMGVDNVNFQAKCARGYAYYDSKVAPRHPRLKRDILTPLVRGARREGLGVFLYTCCCTDVYCAHEYADMQLLDQNGLPHNRDVVCLNGPYRARYLRLVDELARRYAMDGLFVDGVEVGYGSATVWPAPCYCAACKEQWLARFRESLPRDAQKVCRERLLTFLQDNADAFVKDVVHALRRRQPRARVWINTSRPFAAAGESFAEVDAFHRNFFRPNLFMKRTRALSHGQPYNFSMTFDKPVHHGESDAMVAWEVATFLAHRPHDVMMWSSPDLATMWYAPQAARKIAGAVAAVKDLRDEMAEPMAVLADVALGHSDRDVLLNAPAPRECWHSDELVGAFRLFSDAHIPFDLVDLDAPLKLKGIPVLWVGSLTTLPATQVQAILEWVRAGGRLIATGVSPLVRALPGLKLGERFSVENTSNWNGATPAAYVKPDWRADGDPWSLVRGYFPVLKRAGWAVRGRLFPQAIYRSGRDYDHAHRPSAQAAGAAILSRSIGKGRVLYFNHEVFADSINRGVNLFRDIPAACLRELGVQARFELAGCLNVESNAYRMATGYKLVLTNGFVGRPVVSDGEPSPWGEISDVVTVADLTLTCRLPVRRAHSRQQGELDLRRNADGSLTALLPKLGLWDVVTWE